jgi:hypothetical protein
MNCCVCGSEEIVFTTPYVAGLSGIKESYCQYCRDHDLMPYSSLVSLGFCVSTNKDDFVEPIRSVFDESLERSGHTLEELEADVKRIMDAYIADCMREEEEEPSGEMEVYTVDWSGDE